MSIKLSKEQIKDIRHLQKNLDIRVRELNNISLEEDLTLEKYIALKTEVFEFVNEIESFKYWKKKKGKDHILEEACDTLHFIFSIAIDKDVELDMDEVLGENYNPDNYEFNDLIGVMDAMISDCYIENDWEDLNGVLMILCILLDKCNFNADDLYKAYIDKNKVNHDRQSNNY